MSRPHLAIWATMALSLVPAFGRADSASDAHQVLQHRLAMPTPTTPYAKWLADQWTFAAAECLQGTVESEAAKAKEDLANLNKLRLYLGGSRSLPKDLTNTCAAMAAKGPDAECFEFKSYRPPFTSPWPGMPSNYLYLKDDKLPAEGSELTIVSYCNLVKGSPDTRQFFDGNAKLHWLAQPRMMQLQTFAGPRSLKVGTVSFVAPGMPGSGRPMMLLVP